MEDQVRRFLERMAEEVHERHETPRAMLRRANHLRARSLLALGVVGALIAYGGIAGMDFLSGQREQNVGESTCSWTRMATPNPGNVRNFLSDVAVLAPDDVWAVGGYKWDPQAPPTPSPGGQVPTGGGLRRGLNHPLALHWDGVSWTQVAFPEPTAAQIANATDIIIVALEAISPDDVWAVGSGGVYGGPGFFVHWDGSRWSFVAPAGESAVTDLAARSSDDIWAVGDHAGSNGRQPIVHRWNGSTWTEVAFPELPVRGNYLNGVSPVSDAEAWAVGRSWDQPVMSSWGGSAWNLMEIPTDGRADQLSDVAATGEGIAWAVGSSLEDVSGTAPERGLIYRWDGSTWSLQPHPAPPSGQYGFRELAVGGPNDVWAVGTSWGIESSGTSFEYDGLLVEHWDGRQWRIVEGPKVKDMASIGSVDVAPDGDLWIAGSVSTEAAEQTLLLVRNCEQESNDMAPPSASPPATSECASLWDQTREAAREEGLHDGEARRLADEARALCELQATRAGEAVAHAREAFREAAREAAARERQAAARIGEAAPVSAAGVFSCASDDLIRNAPPPVGDPTVVGVYFSCEADVGLPDQPLYLFVRKVPSPSKDLLPRLQAALTSYLIGPDQAEKDRGYLTALPMPIPDALESVSVEGNHATVNFSPALESLNNLSAGTASQVFLTELMRNVFQFAEIEHLTLQIAGDCKRFWKILEGSCQTLDRTG